MTINLPATKDILLKLEGGVLHLIFNRPDANNALTAMMVDEIFTALDLASNERDVSAIVLRGAGGNFCAGGDIKEMAGLLMRSANNDLEYVAEHNARGGELFAKVNEMSKPVIAVLEGTVLGGGLGLACGADIVIARKDIRFGLPEGKLGLIPTQIAPFVVRRVGQSYARLLVAVGSHFDGEAAYRFGLAHYLCDSDAEVEETLRAVLKQVVLGAPQAFAGAKGLMCLTDFPDPNVLGMQFAHAMTSAEGREGTRAFVEKRKPNWNSL